MSYLKHIGLLLREISNPPLFIYHVCHYLNRDVPLWLSQYISKRNSASPTLHELTVSTIDGSDQVVHPDIIKYANGVAMVCTPYPYAMEEYENPCLYWGKSIDKLQSVICPFDRQSEHIQGVHMSDPCILNIRDELLCIYRETIKKDDYIYMKRMRLAGTEILYQSDRHLLMESSDYYILSPAALICGEDLLVYYVKYAKPNQTELILSRFSSNGYHLLESLTMKVENEPSDYYIWHIGIYNADDYGKGVINGDRMKGLFLYQHRKKKTNLKLFHAVSAGVESCKWEIREEVTMPDSKKDSIWFPYKSCYNPQTMKILLSFRDKKSRNRLIEI